MRLIDADALKQTFCAECTLYGENGCTLPECDLHEMLHIDMMPTIEPPEVLVAKITVTKDQLMEAVKKAIADMEPESFWIPVTEELPEEDGEYLVTKEDDWFPEVCVDIARWYKSDHENNGFHKANRVIAWMPLPEPYGGIL